MTKTDLIDTADVRHSWHPFTQMQEYTENPRVHISKGEGCWLYDTEGNKYLDCNASVWTNSHGHNNPEMNQAIKSQLEQVAHSTYLGLSHEPGALLSKKLVSLSPNKLERVFYTDNGSGSIETALKLSFQYRQLTEQTERTGVIAMKNGYHGDTFGTMSVGDNDSWHHWFKQWMFPCYHISTPICKEYGGNVYEEDMRDSLTELRSLLDENGSTISCLVMEPLIQGPAGMQLQPRGFLKEVELLCKEYGVHLILDEVFVGLGRTGSIFACSQEDVQPDFLCISKGLTGGYLPLAATLTTDEIYQAFLNPFHEFKAFIHGHTYCGNPLACAAALKSLELLELLINSGNLTEMIKHFETTITKSFENHPHVKEIRQKGLACAIDIYPGGSTEAEFPIKDRIGQQISIEARKHNLLIRPLLNSILIVPPLVITPDEIDFLCSNLINSINTTLFKYEKLHARGN